MSGPKTFISYSWTSKDHERWVLDLATALRDNGVDVILDKWDLREGHDAIAFMEKMVTDPSVQKVIMILDRRYAEKADDRKGGVGTETQIITPHIYERADQNKFVGVTSEVDADGKPFKPAYYASRIHIDLSNDDAYATNFEHLLRWIFDKPAYPKPALGKPPEFLNEQSLALPTRSHAQRAISLLRSAAPGALGALREYLETVSDNLELLRLEGSQRDDFDEEVLKSINAFLPYRDEYVSVITAVVRATPSDDDIVALKRFFERLIPFLSRPQDMMNWSEHWFDNYRFIIHELFLYTVAILIKHEKFQVVAEFLGDGFYSSTSAESGRSSSLESFAVFRQHLSSIARRNKRLGLRRLSLHADLIKNRVPARGVTFDDLMQADLVLFIRAAAIGEQWWPESLVWVTIRHRSPFEIFARGRSIRYLKRLLPMLGVSTRDELSSVIDLFYDPSKGAQLPRWEFDSVPLKQLTAADELGTAP
jgi:TIR domain